MWMVWRLGLPKARSTTRNEHPWSPPRGTRLVSQSKPEATELKPWSGWLVVLAAFFGVMAGFGSLVVFTFSVFLKPVGNEFGWNREAVSSAFGFAALSVAV